MSEREGGREERCVRCQRRMLALARCNLSPLTTFPFFLIPGSGGGPDRRSAREMCPEHPPARTSPGRTPFVVRLFNPPARPSLDRFPARLAVSPSLFLRYTHSSALARGEKVSNEVKRTTKIKKEKKVRRELTGGLHNCSVVGVRRAAPFLGSKNRHGSRVDAGDLRKRWFIAALLSGLQKRVG